MFALPLYKLIPTKPYKEFNAAMRRLLSLAGKITEKKMAELTRALEEGQNVKGIGFLDQWLLEGKLRHEQILPIFGDFIIACTENVSWFQHGILTMKFCLIIPPCVHMYLVTRL